MRSMLSSAKNTQKMYYFLLQNSRVHDRTDTTGSVKPKVLLALQNKGITKHEQTLLYKTVNHFQ